MPQEEYRASVSPCRDGVRKVKADLELLQGAGDVKENKKGFHKYINSKRKTKQNMSLLLNKTRELGIKKAKVLNTLFDSVLINKYSLKETQASETTG